LIGVPNTILIKPVLNLFTGELGSKMIKNVLQTGASKNPLQIEKVLNETIEFYKN
jgi:hypothetical protein